MQPINRFCRPPAHATKWTVVVDRPREARTLTLFNTQADAHAEIIRFRERGVAHVFALAPVAATASKAARNLEANRKLDLAVLIHWALTLLVEADVRVNPVDPLGPCGVLGRHKLELGFENPAAVSCCGKLLI
jgi:hypothetical protein